MSSNDLTAKRQDLYAAVGARVRQRRGKTLTQADLAKQLGVTRSSIAQIERGRQQMLLHTFLDLAHALRIPPLELLPSEDGDSEQAPREPQPREVRNWVEKALARGRSRRRHV